jgi:hypothetical protein
VNKALRDENDALRATIDSNKSAVSPSDVCHSMNSFLKKLIICSSLLSYQNDRCLGQDLFLKIIGRTPKPMGMF